MVETGHNACRFPPFRCCRSSVAVSSLPLVSRCRFRSMYCVHRCRCRCSAVAYLAAVYGCNGTEFSYVFFSEQRNFTTAERRNGNGRTATEWWKPGFRAHALCGPFRAKLEKPVTWCSTPGSSQTDTPTMCGTMDITKCNRFPKQSNTAIVHLSLLIAIK